MTLWLIRHAKSSWADSGQRDFDRSLNARGERDGPRMQAWLSQQTDPAQWLWTSSAARALATADYVQVGFGLSDDRKIAERSLYHASPEQILDVLRTTPENVQSVALVAHNPGLTWLVNQLGGRTVTVNLPTFGVARFQGTGAWTDLGRTPLELDLLEAPKTIG